jgi:hypothetical protein
MRFAILLVALLCACSSTEEPRKVSGVLFYLPNARQLSTSGGILPGWYAQFYLTDSTTPAPIYADGDLETPLDNPVEADVSGMMPPIYLDPELVYRVQIYTAADVLIDDVDPFVVMGGSGGGGIVQTVVAGDNITVDATDPANPIVSASSGDLTEYPDPAHEWYGASNVVVDSSGGQIAGDPIPVWDGTQWVVFFWRTVTGSPFVRSYYRTAPTLEGPWSSATELAALAGYHKPTPLVDEFGAPVEVGGSYHLYASFFDGDLDSKEIFHFTASTLTGTWTLGSKVIAKGAAGTKDEYYADTPCPVYKDGTFYIWYMGAPASSLPTYGLAVRKLRATASAADGPFTKDYDDVIDLSTTPAEWNYGYHGGTQILRRPNGGYMMLLNAGDTRPPDPGVEPDGSRMGYAYADSIDGPWTYDDFNPYYTFDGTPSDALDQDNIWRVYVAWDHVLKRWYLYYNTGSGDEVVTYARQNAYAYSNAAGGGGSYNIQALTTSAVQIDGTRVNLTPGIYRVGLQVNYIPDSDGTIRALDIDTVLRVNGTPVGVANRDFIGSYAYENRDTNMDRIVAMSATGYIDVTTQVTGGTPSGSFSFARRLRINVEKVAASPP